MGSAAEDNILGKKIAGIVTLPDGYAPNLDSKWLLIEAALERKKNTPATGWLKYTALFAVLLSFFYEVTDKAIKPVAVPQKQATAEKAAPKPTEARYVSSGRKMEPRLGPHERKGQPVAALPVQPAMPYINADLPEPTANVLQAQPKPKKKRYTQLDFGGPLVQKQGDAPDPEHLVQIKILPRKDQTANDRNNERALLSFESAN